MLSGKSCKIIGTSGMSLDGSYPATVIDSKTFSVPLRATGTYIASSGSVCQNYSRKSVVYANNCTFRYTGYFKGPQKGNGITVNNFSGTSIFIRCDASGNGSDGFNFHDTRHFGLQSLTVNCTGRRNGLEGSTSNNGLTSHEGVVLIDVSGYYLGNSGYTVHSIDHSKTFLVGTVARNSRGDKIFGGTFDPGEFRVSDAAQLWLYATLALPSENYGAAYTASDSAIIYHRFLPAIGGSVIVDQTARFKAY
jgi:hypothetical protein